MMMMNKSLLNFANLFSVSFAIGLSHCRHLKTVRTHLSGLVHPVIVSIDYPVDASNGVTLEVWSKMMSSGLVSVSVLYNMMSNGLVSVSVLYNVMSKGLVSDSGLFNVMSKGLVSDSVLYNVKWTGQ